MNVYVVDDEPKIRRGLVHFIAGARPQWPYPRCAGSAEEAMADPAFWDSDLLFLDIRLPDKNGLEFLEEIRRRGNTMQVIIISGHAEFSFAQKALSLQVREYLLKPIDIQRLRSLLEDAEGRLLQSQQNSRILQTAQQNLHMVREKYFANLLFGAESPEPQACAARLKELEMADSPFVVVQYTYQDSQNDHSDSVREVRQLLSEKLRSHLPNPEQVFLIYLKTGIVAILIAPDDELDRILEAFQGNSDTRDYVVGASFIHPTLSELLVAYREATRTDLPVEDSAQALPLEDQTSYVDQLLARQDSFHPYVQKILSFIAENYQAPLSLTVISGHIHLHSSYLSELFKRETGTNLCNYITDYRLKMAKQKLLGGKEKISAIAELVGFNDYHYFSQVFARRVGVSPRKYRVSHL